MTQRPVARLSDPDRALFVSDVHLQDAQPTLAARFFEALSTQGQRATHVFILGDLFEAWIGDDQDDACSRRCCELLAALRSAGTAVYLLRGNRDFLLGERLPPGSGAPVDWSRTAELTDDEVVVDLFGAACLIAHGDRYCTDDHAYQAFRSQRDTAEWRAAFLSRPLAERQALARAMREQSEREKADKSNYLMDVNPAAVASAMSRAGCARLIHGHTHRPAVHRWMHHAVPFERWVLPDWQEQPRRGGFLAVTASGFETVGDWH